MVCVCARARVCVCVYYVRIHTCRVVEDEGKEPYVSKRRRVFCKEHKRASGMPVLIGLFCSLINLFLGLFCFLIVLFLGLF